MASFFFLSLRAWLLEETKDRIRTRSFLQSRKKRLGFPSLAGKMTREAREPAMKRQIRDTMLHVTSGGLWMSLQGVVKSTAKSWPALVWHCWLIKHISYQGKNSKPLHPNPWKKSKYAKSILGNIKASKITSSAQHLLMSKPSHLLSLRFIQSGRGEGRELFLKFFDGK